MVEVWDIYCVFTTYTTPPKDKFVAVVCVEPEILGFFINSEINQFVQKRPKILPCIVGLPATQNPYLQYDSFLDCREARITWRLSL